jgi:hypothetical protein
MYLAPSSSGPGRRPLKAVAPVQIRSGLREKYQVEGLIAETSGQILDHPSVVRPWSSASSDGNRHNRVIVIDSVLRPEPWLP